MHLGERCDEIVHLIEETLAEVSPARTAGPGAAGPGAAGPGAAGPGGPPAPAPGAGRAATRGTTGSRRRSRALHPAARGDRRGAGL